MTDADVPCCFSPACCRLPTRSDRRAASAECALGGSSAACKGRQCERPAVRQANAEGRKRDDKEKKAKKGEEEKEDVGRLLLF